jgi:hypothetical protein
MSGRGVRCRVTWGRERVFHIEDGIRMGWVICIIGHGGREYGDVHSMYLGDISIGLFMAFRTDMQLT